MTPELEAKLMSLPMERLDEIFEAIKKAANAKKAKLESWQEQKIKKMLQQQNKLLQIKEQLRVDEDDSEPEGVEDSVSNFEEELAYTLSHRAKTKKIRAKHTADTNTPNLPSSDIHQHAYKINQEAENFGLDLSGLVADIGRYSK